MTSDIKSVKVYPLVTFYDVSRGVLFKTSDFDVIRSMGIYGVNKPLKVGDRLELKGKNVEIVNIAVNFMDSIGNHRSDLPNNQLYEGELVPFNLQLDIYVDMI